MMSHSRSQGTEVTIVTGDVFPTDDGLRGRRKGCGGPHQVLEQPPTEMVERTTEKHDILLSLKKSIAAFRQRRSSHLIVRLRPCYGKCPRSGLL